MPGSGTEDLISRIDSLDLAFTGLWSESVRLECGTFFSNPDMPNDIFFDKLAGIKCLDDKMIGEALGLFEKYHTVPYFYLHAREDLEKVLAGKGFRLYDVQRVLAAKPSHHATAALRVGAGGAMRWAETFCSAYDCMGWIGAVSKVVQGTSDKIEYYLDEQCTSCVALYEKGQVLGLYCLGTVPRARRRGQASLLVDFAAGEAGRRGLDLLVLETYERDGLGDFYDRLGFGEVYRKKIYTI